MVKLQIMYHALPNMLKQNQNKPVKKCHPNMLCVFPREATSQQRQAAHFLLLQWS